MKNIFFPFFISLLFLSCKKVKVLNEVQVDIFPNLMSNFAFYQNDTVQYSILLPEKFNYEKNSWDQSSCSRLPFEKLFLVAAKDSNLIRSQHGGWGPLEPYQLMPLIDSLYVFDFFSLDKTLYPNNWYNRHSKFNYREIIPRGETPVLGHGKIRLVNNCQIYYVLYQDYQSSILQGYIINPEFMIKVNYEQFNFLNFSKIDSALIAFQTFTLI